MNKLKDLQAAKAYGFLPEPIKEKSVSQWIASQVKAGKKVGSWSEGGFKLHWDAKQHKEFKEPSLNNLWESLDYFSEGFLDLLVCKDLYIAFPEKGKEILKSIQEAVQGGSPNLDSLKDFNSQDPYLVNQWGKLLSFTKQFGEAGQAFREAVELLNEYAEPYSNLGTLLWNFGKRREALLLFSEAIMKNPHRAEIQINFFDAAHDMEEYEFMAKIIETLLPSVEDFSEFKHHLAICYQKTERVGEAKSILNEILTRDPKDQEAKLLLKDFELASQPTIGVQ